jgi:AcrR family transcriptional regulator
VSGDGEPAVELREHLVATAAALVAERGTTALTTREIARAAGVSDGVLYNYFADKSELVVAALVRRFETVIDDFGGDLPAPGTATVEDNLLRYVQHLHDVVRETLPMVAGLVTEHALLHRVLAEIHRPGRGILPFLSRIGEYLVEEQRLGRVAADADLPAAMMLLTGSATTLTMRSHILTDPVGAEVPGFGVDEHELMRRNVRTLLAGIAGEQRST